MSELTRPVRTSLSVGFSDGEGLGRFERFRGRSSRTVGAVDCFPFQDGQFEVVIIAGSAVSRKAVKEANRVLVGEGRLFFTVPEKGKKTEGFTLPDIYSLVREGFNIVEVDRVAWWRFWVKDRMISICAKKKRWREKIGVYRPYV